MKPTRMLQDTENFKRALYVCKDGSKVEYYWDARGPWWGAYFTSRGIGNNYAYGPDQAKAWNAVKSFIECHGGVA